MSDSLGFALAIVFDEILPAAIMLYAAYWAFAFRRALVGHIYRNHALWLGALCILFTLMPVSNIQSSNGIIATVAGVYPVASILIGFAFIDSTMPIARRSDPLLRSTFHWERVRIAVWGEICALAIYVVFSEVNPSFASSPIAAILGIPLFSFPFILGAPAILIGARRSKDSVLRASLKWFGVALVMFLATMLVFAIETLVLGISSSNMSYSYPALGFVPTTVLAGFALYRSARSLAPMNHLQAMAPATIPPAVPGAIG